MRSIKKIRRSALMADGAYVSPPDDFSQYLTLDEAGQASGYTAVFLGLLIDNRELRAVKISQDWFTKIDWINDYAKRVEIQSKQEAEVRRNIELIRVARSGFSPAAIPVSVSNISIKRKASGGRGDFYLWFTALAFLLFFAATFGQSGFRSVWLDARSVAGQAVYSPAVLDRGAPDGARSESGAVSIAAGLLAELYVAPAMPDDSFSPFFSGSFASLSRVAFIPQINTYVSWVIDSMKAAVAR